MLSCGGDELTLMPNAEGEEGCSEGRKVGLPGEGFKIGYDGYQSYQDPLRCQGRA